MPKYIYHICITYNDPYGQGQGYWDGIATLDNEILTIEDYRDVKIMIANEIKRVDISPNNIIIVTLNLLKKKGDKTEKNYIK